MVITFIKNYSHWRPGEHLEIPDDKGRKLIAQGYAEEGKMKSKPAPIRVVETADARPAEEDATVTPFIPKRGPGRPRKADKENSNED